MFERPLYEGNLWARAQSGRVSCSELYRIAYWHPISTKRLSSIAPRAWTWSALLLSSVAFGALHGHWILGTLSGPIILVGHSYGGAVITEAATGNPNVKALVYEDAARLIAVAVNTGDAAAALGGVRPGEEVLLAPHDGPGAT